MNDTETPAIATPAQWRGCATLNQDNPMLWIGPVADDANREVQGFSLAEVIEAGLRQKIVGLADADKEPVIADCAADALENLNILHRTNNELSELVATLQNDRCTVAESTEEDEAFELMIADAENDLRAEGERIYRIRHHYDIGNQDVYVEHRTGDVDGKRVALYLWFKACEWFGVSVVISNLGIASVMVAFYGFRHCAIHPFPTTVDLYADAEGFRGYEDLMNDPSLQRDGLREALAPHVDGAAN